MGIHEAVIAIEELLRVYTAAGTKPIAVQVRPSGDDVDVIKVWVELGADGDADAWMAAAEAAVRKAVPNAAPFKLQIRTD